MFVERWTIDEIGDGVVRVLAARSLDPEALGLLAERSRAATASLPGESAPDESAHDERVQEVSAAEVMAVELGTAVPLDADADGGPDADAGASSDLTNADPSWTEEQDSVLDALSLAAFVTRFREKVEGVVERPLRETDVFWVVATDEPAQTLSEGQVRRSDTDQLLAGYATATPVVRDMTGPARQASKVLYHDAFRKSEEQA